jgi:hypothetical protein
MADVKKWIIPLMVTVILTLLMAGYTTITSALESKVSSGAFAAEQKRVDESIGVIKDDISEIKMEQREFRHEVNLTLSEIKDMIYNHRLSKEGR